MTTRPPITVSELHSILANLITAGHGAHELVVSWSGDAEDDQPLGDALYIGETIVRLVPHEDVGGTEH